MKTIQNRLDIERATRQIGNRFDLVLVAATRTRELSRGRAPMINTENKVCVTALLEIEDGHIGREMLKRIGPARSKK
jgi:DNA-directed RNA polymerase subunit omega